MTLMKVQQNLANSQTTSRKLLNIPPLLEVKLEELIRLEKYWSNLAHGKKLVDIMDTKTDIELQQLFQED